MNIVNCSEGHFTDNVFQGGAKCASSRPAFLASIVVIIVIQAFTSIMSCVRWGWKNWRRAKVQQSQRYWCHRRLPILPILLTLVSTSSIVFWSLASVDIANYENRVTVMLFALHIFVAYVMMHFYMWRFIRIGIRFNHALVQQPVASRDENDDARGSLDGSVVTSTCDTSVIVAFGCSIIASTLGFMFGILGAPLASDVTQVIAGGCVSFAIGGLGLMVTFILQIRSTIRAVELVKSTAPFDDITRLADLDRMVMVLRRHRRIAVGIMIIMSGISLFIAFFEQKPWYLLYMADMTMVGHTLLIWVEDFIYYRLRGERLSENSPHATHAPGRKRENPRALEDSPDGDNLMLVSRKSNSSPKSKVSPYVPGSFFSEDDSQFRINGESGMSQAKEEARVDLAE